MNINDLNDYKLLVVIIRYRLGSKVIKLAKQVGVKGGTIIRARGSTKKEMCEKILGISFEPDKDLVLIAFPNHLEEQLLSVLCNQMNFIRPGKGIAFVIDLKKVSGISHLLNKKKEG